MEAAHGSGSGRDRTGRGQIAGDGLQVGVGLGRVDVVEALVELVEREPALPGGLLEHLGGLVAVGVGDPQMPAVGWQWGIAHNLTLTATAADSRPALHAEPAGISPPSCSAPSPDTP